MMVLDGLRVVDFSRVMSGPLCTAFLADLGAEVVKIEAPAGGDDSRRFGPFVNGASIYFALLNRGKQSVAIDLKHAEGRALALDLIGAADVVVENFRPGVAARLGIDYAAARARNERVVYLSISGFGAASPLRDWPAYDLIVQAMSGVMSTTGAAGGPPTALGESLADVWTGLCGSWAVLAALVARERTGRGEHVDLAMFDAMLAMQLTGFAQLFARGVAPGRVGNRHPVTTPVDTYATRDGHVALVVTTDAQFAALAKLMSAPQLAQDARFATNDARRAHYAALGSVIEAWTRAYSSDEVAALCRAAGLPAGPVWDLAQALASEQVAERDLAPEVPHPSFGALRVLRQPARFAGASTAPARAEPRLGEHTDAVLDRVLGVSQEHRARLRAAGVIV
jgi:CoA:oxalate CoA-transferase